MPQEVHMSQKDYYVAIWEEIFGSLLGWPRARVVEWARDLEAAVGEPFMDDDHDIFYHESPLYWAAPFLIPNDLRQRLLPSEDIALAERILEASGDEPSAYDPPIGTDWEPFRARVDQILGEYGSSLSHHTRE